ncbi:MAG: hypothetical protein UV40_C0024G0011 [Parcubacteria group bacterium GW2011_GWA1_42_7]|nr:MAG: hypothetical protein UV34_C0025G0012 [Parcubacteria group bacterium GW2011_GWB1_42_6]KKS69409.1 MAG: hypothetical protein UV40_C0024G0011 [Parcubacteria group bacterium GW2011_GWA1_42_7]KKS91988.1 MAG: hypothetical protein UV67_C0013G0013 [Parcubacteria group bacterium GW2011_GWC1_43_12]
METTSLYGAGIHVNSILKTIYKILSNPGINPGQAISLEREENTGLDPRLRGDDRG